MFPFRIIIVLISALISSSVFARGLTVLPHCEDPERLPAQAAEQARLSTQYPCASIVQFWPASSNGDIAELLNHGAATTRLTLNDNVRSIAISSNRSYRTVRDSDLVFDIYPDRIVHGFPKPDNTGKPDKENNTSSEELPAGVSRVNGGHFSGSGIAIVDTGVADDTADLNRNNACHDSFLSASDPARCLDGNGHGTHVAGTAAAIDNDTGVVGVAPNTEVFAVRVLNNSGSGNDSTIIAGLQWVLAHHNALDIEVINMSLGREGTVGDSPVYESAVADLISAGLTVVVAAGNDPSLEVKDNVPANYPGVIAVASTTAIDGKNQGCRHYSGIIPTDTASYFTTDGTAVSISAPGSARENISKNCRIRAEGILSLSPGGGTARMSGTSMAAPHVAAAAALGVDLSTARDNVGSAPLPSPTNSYSYDGTQEGILRLAD